MRPTPAALPAFLEGAEYRAVDQRDIPELRRRLLDPIGLHDEPVAPYEHLCLAERGRCHLTQARRWMLRPAGDQAGLEVDPVWLPGVISPVPGHRGARLLTVREVAARLV